MGGNDIVYNQLTSDGSDENISREFRGWVGDVSLVAIVVNEQWTDFEISAGWLWFRQFMRIIEQLCSYQWLPMSHTINGGQGLLLLLLL
jgi:hypothetical protein